MRAELSNPAPEMAIRAENITKTTANGTLAGWTVADVPMGFRTELDVRNNALVLLFRPRRATVMLIE